ncbi:MAG TPA: Uma2 family endonuclease [Nitriliruptorales bacterium]
MGETGTRGLTYDDVVRTRPETNRFEELIDGELVVSPGPTIGHQRAVGAIFLHLAMWARANGAEAFTGPFDVYVEATTVVQPDVLVLGPDQPKDIERPLRYPPLLCVEVLSPSNRAHDLVKKRAIYERFGVRELWFVDLDSGRVEQVVLGPDGTYGRSTMHAAGDAITSAVLDGLTVPAAEALGQR